MEAFGKQQRRWAEGVTGPGVRWWLLAMITAAAVVGSAQGCTPYSTRDTALPLPNYEPIVTSYSITRDSDTRPGSVTFRGTGFVDRVTMVRVSGPRTCPECEELCLTPNGKSQFTLTCTAAKVGHGECVFEPTNHQYSRLVISPISQARERAAAASDGESMMDWWVIMVVCLIICLSLIFYFVALGFYVRKRYTDRLNNMQFHYRDDLEDIAPSAAGSLPYALNGERSAALGEKDPSEWDELPKEKPVPPLSGRRYEDIHAGLALYSGNQQRAAVRDPPVEEDETTDWRPPAQPPSSHQQTTSHSQPKPQFSPRTGGTGRRHASLSPVLRTPPPGVGSGVGSPQQHTNLGGSVMSPKDYPSTQDYPSPPGGSFGSPMHGERDRSHTYANGTSPGIYSPSPAKPTSPGGIGRGGHGAFTHPQQPKQAPLSEDEWPDLDQASDSSLEDAVENYQRQQQYGAGGRTGPG